MGSQTAFHAPHGAAGFLGWRRRHGEAEIIYDDGVKRHLVWRLARDPFDEEQLSEALRMAVESQRIVTALHEELHKRAIRFERIDERFGG